MPEYVHSVSNSFVMCNRCGGLTKETYHLLDKDKTFCPDCFATTSGYVEATEVITLDKVLYKSMRDSIKDSNRFSSWYVYGKSSGSGDCKKWICDSIIAWSHDPIGRPVFNPREHLLEMHKMIARGKMRVMTMTSVPNLSNISDALVKKYASFTDTSVLCLMDCSDSHSFECYRNVGDALSKVSLMIA